ncbi:helicase SNF [Anaerobacillus alkalilacustris]|uniref:Helicase SNF n=1 Tax=Anaerobacillus alkalilacustris TaxID=393763 RepID=A0A1S2LGS3_9BACI|nr:helicase SNF [Anaerobacillus alkalilacustris]
MNINITPKKIKEMCGTVSFKKGSSFQRANNVTFKHYHSNGCEATVKGTEEFFVKIEMLGNGSLHATCSCPKLLSYEKDCQHIAAVLLSIHKHQHQGLPPLNTSDLPSIDQTLTDELLTLFSDRLKPSSGQQIHFEKRQIIEILFTCKPVLIEKGQLLLGIEMKFGQTVVKNVREFLINVKEGKSYNLSPILKYDPKHHCFDRDADAILQHLIQIAYDEVNEKELASNQLNYLCIPPSSWNSFQPLLERASFVKWEYHSNIYDSILFSQEPLDLQFEIKEDDRKGYQLKIDGLQHLIALPAYSSVLVDGKVIQMENDDCKRVFELKQMLEASRIDNVPIPKEKINFFIEKVIPGLQKIGNVQLCEEISKEFVKAPLLAKLYLDRVNNRLLAGLEFHYEHLVINPLENVVVKTGHLFSRDERKEEIILQLMDESGFAKTDGGYFMHNEKMEYEFLYHVVPKLEKLVQIYATTSVKNRIFKGNAIPKINIKVKKDRTNWLEFKFDMNGISDNQIREILAALEEKRKYYRMKNGSLLSLETREFDDMKSILNTFPNQLDDLQQGLRIPIARGLEILDTVEGNGVLSFQESFREFINHLRNPGSLDFAIPEVVEPVLRGYQKRGFKWMKTLANYGFGGILADDMGLGKTLQSITFILSELPEIRKKKLPILIVCTSSLLYNWFNEIRKFSPDVKAVVIDGNKKDRIKCRQSIVGIDVLITSYPLLRADIKWYEEEVFHAVFFDEAQAFKNPLTQTARAVKKLQAHYRFALTGTPVENSLVELWSIFHVVFPELFSGLKDYSKLSNDAIARRTRLFLLRRMKEDVLNELPKKFEVIETVDLLPDQKKLYAAYLSKLKHETLKHLNKETIRKSRIRILAGLTRLRQICCHPGLFVDGYNGTSSKYEQLLSILEQAKLSGRRVLVFSQFTKMLELIGRELAKQGVSFFYLDGQTPSEERVKMCERFNRGDRNLFLISLKAGGTGLNLTGADTVILYDSWWNPAVEEQAADRAHRIGQTNEVQVIKLVAKGTIEEKMNELQEKKRQLIEDILNPVQEEKSSVLTEEDIREILMV